jgi:tRNA(Ile)-lysidine synthase
VLHVNHALRTEADKEQRFVETLCQRLHVLYVTTTLTPPRVRTGIEAWARSERYRFFHAALERHDLNAVAVAHTRDDQAETVLFHLLRGSARRGLAGIPPAREGWLIRPLLGCSRQEVLAYLAAQNLSSLTDASNADLRYTRNKIRHVLLPLLERAYSPQVRRHLASLADSLRAEEEWLETLAAESRQRAQDGPEALSVSRLAAEPTALRTRMLRQWVEQLASVHEVGLVHLTSLRALSEGRLRGKVEVPGEVWVRRAGDQLLLESKHTQPDPPVSYTYGLTPGQEIFISENGWRIAMSASLPWEGSLAQVRALDPWHALFDAEAVSEAVIVRNVRPGDRMRPLGSTGQKKVHDIFINRKIPLERRQRFPLVVMGEDIAWVPGHVRGETAKITTGTRRVYRLVAQCCKPIAGETTTMLGCQNVLKGNRE